MRLGCAKLKGDHFQRTSAELRILRRNVRRHDNGVSLIVGQENQLRESNRPGSKPCYRGAYEDELARIWHCQCYWRFLKNTNVQPAVLDRLRRCNLATLRQN